MSLFLQTPLIESEPLGQGLGGRVWLKLEALQPSGSFKNRGMGTASAQAVQSGAGHLICSSGGNAGLAVAYSGRRLGVPVTIVVPESTGSRACGLIEAQGATVLIEGASWDNAHEHALSLIDESSAYIHPFDDPVVWRGHSSMIDEVLDQGPVPDLVVVSAGGGGLFCGVMEGLDRHGLSSCRVLVLETRGADSLHRSLLAGELIRLSRIESIATTLGARQVAAKALELALRPTIESATVTDRQALDACLRFAQDHRILVEPACGAALAAVYQKLPAVCNAKEILMIVCGGASVSLQMLDNWKTGLNT